jgi:uncharacterized membrane protein
MTSGGVNVIPYDDRESGPNWRGKPGVNVGEAERWASIFGGAALIVTGLKKSGVAGLTVSALGGSLMYRGLTGHCAVYDAMQVNTTGEPSKGLHVVKAVTINRQPADLFAFWRNFENLPHFMKHLNDVNVLDAYRSRWVAKGPAGKTVEWDAEIINERKNELIAWRSLDGADVQNAGTVNFLPAPGGRGTEVKVTLQYVPPGGIIGAQIARLWGEEPSLQVESDLLRFKQLMEAGEIPTTEGQPHG